MIIVLMECETDIATCSSMKLTLIKAQVILWSRTGRIIPSSFPRMFYCVTCLTENGIPPEPNLLKPLHYLGRNVTPTTFSKAWLCG